MKDKKVFGPATEVPLTHKFLLLVTSLWTLAFMGVAQAPPPCILYASNFGGGATTLTALQSALNGAAGCWLFINQNYAFTAGVDTVAMLPLTIPRLTLITGVGPQGSASISFAQVPLNTNANAITVANPTGQDYVVIENLVIQGPTAQQGFTGTMNGLHLVPPTGGGTGQNPGPGIVYLRNLVIRNFTVGVYGSNSLSVFADNCNVSSNQTDNYQLNASSNSWRIRGGLCSLAGRGLVSGCGININSANNTVIDGVRMESNLSGAIRTATDSTQISNCRFESNNILIDAGATATTLVNNYYSSAAVTDNSDPSTTLQFDNNINIVSGRFPASLLLGSKRLNDLTTPAEVFGNHFSTSDAYKALVTANNSTTNDSTYTYANSAYGSWVQELDGRPAASESNSQFRLYYRTAGSAQGKGTVVFSVDRNGNLVSSGQVSTTRLTATGPLSAASLAATGQVSAASLVASVNTVPFSTTPTFDASLGNTQKITLTANITSSTLTNATTGQTVQFMVCQDAAGLHTFVWPSNVKGGMMIGTSPATCSAQSFIFDGTNAYAISPGSTNM